MNKNKIRNVIDKENLLKIIRGKSKFFIFGGVLGLVLFIYFVNTKYNIANPSTSYEMVHVEKRNLAKSITVNGEVLSENEVELTPDSSGKIAEIYVKVGQAVAKGQLLAQVENTSQKAQVTQTLGALQAAEAQVLSAQAQLDKIVNGSSQEDKNIIASQVNAAERAVSSAQESARNALQNAYAGTVNAILFGADVAILNPDTVNPTLKFQTVEYSAKIMAENKRVIVGGILKRHKQQSASSINTKMLADELQDTKDELVELREFADSLLTAVDGAISTASISRSTINSYANTIKAARAEILANITALTNAQYAIVSAAGALDTVQENENKVLGSAREEDISIARANVNAVEAAVTSAGGNYQIARAALEKTYVRSPFAGIVTDISKDVGELVSASVPFVKISSEGKYVSALVSEVDIAKVKTGAKVILELDALPEQVFIGKVDFIYPDMQEEMGIVYYEIKVSSDELESNDFKILPGLSLDVAIDYAQMPNVLAIERSAVKKDENGKYFVWVLNKDKKKPIDPRFVKVFFENGFVGDEYIEVLSGIPEDVDIVKFISSKKE